MAKIAHWTGILLAIGSGIILQLLPYVSSAWEEGSSFTERLPVSAAIIMFLVGLVLIAFSPRETDEPKDPTLPAGRSLE